MRRSARRTSGRVAAAVSCSVRAPLLRRAYTWLRVCCCWVRHARVVQCGCLLLGVCETFQRVSQRGYISPFVLQGPNLGNLVACVLLMNTATMPSFIHSYITCQTSVTNIPARAAAGRRGQNVRYIPAVWQRPTSGHVRPLSKHVPVVSSCCRFTRRARASLSLSLSQAIGSRSKMLLLPIVAFLLRIFRRRAPRLATTALSQRQPENV